MGKLNDRLNRSKLFEYIILYSVREMFTVGCFRQKYKVGF